MRALAILLLILVSGAVAAQTRNPFGAGPPGGSSVAKPQNCSLQTPGFLTRTAPQITDWQRDLKDRLSSDVRTYQESGAAGPLLAILVISFLYGVFHAVGPGHGKIVTTTYFAANRARPSHGLAMTGMISFVQALSAIGIVGVLAVLFSFGPTRVVQNVTYVEAASHLLILLVGVYIAYGGVIGRGCSHTHKGLGENDHRHRHAHVHADDPYIAPQTAGFWSMASAAVAAGIRPCTGAILVLLFTLSHGIFGIGVLSAFVMALGVFLVLAALGLGVIYARRSLSRAGVGRPVLADLAHRVVGIIGGLFIVALGAVLLLGSLEALGVCI
jgi:ABC-type nickel/cobalt efflux system permease component RcnA